MKYNSDYFIKKVEDTPEEMFCALTYKDSGKMCILSMCGQSWGRRSNEAEILISLFDKINAFPSYVNDGIDKRFKQKTPKKRLLAALRSIKIVEQQEANVMAFEEIELEVL